ncbi:hypothetical protein F2Q70_00034428 [Brassica cretica]|uniref:Uncharacterized protein n=1 Tax=Brassica cretica TaxID=69181 RepID=A0A8S9JYK4_BRACR|nr:hypothetical protein F2Q70_00034428 [Brassica cretica]
MGKLSKSKIIGDSKGKLAWGLDFTFIFSLFSLDGETFLPHRSVVCLLRSLHTELLSHLNLVCRFQSKQGSQTSSTNVGDHEIRPEGIKAAKARRNNAQGKTLDECEAEEVKEQMGQDYSYSQPSWSEDYYRNTTDSGYSQAEADILEDQAESRDTQYGHLADKVDHLTFLSGYETQLNQVKDLHNDTEQKLIQLEKLLCELAKKKSKFTNGFELGVGVMVVVLVLVGLVLMYN